MKIFSKSQIVALEEETMKTCNLSSLDLIQAASEAFVAYFIDSEFDINVSILIYCGNGRNGADGIQIANRLVSQGYNVELGILNISKKNTLEFDECASKVFNSIPLFTLDMQDLPSHIIPFHDVLIDGMLGTGLNRELNPNLGNFIKRLNLFNSYKLAIDIPTGLFTDEGNKGVALMCNETIGLSTAKMGYFLEETNDHIGKLTIVDIPVLDQNQQNFESNTYYVQANIISSILKKPDRLTHKYARGHCMLIGGSHGMAGCMKLAGEAALRTGCGIVSLHVPSCAVSFLQASLPEAIIDADNNKYHIGPFELNKKVDAIGIGPGMGINTDQLALTQQLLEQLSDKPMVIDADALTVLKSIDNWEIKLPKNSILTPHKGEFERLFGTFNNQLERIEFMRTFSQKYQIVILLKGADTFISSPNGEIYVNNNGNSSMATAGSGDVLTGMITSLLAQGYASVEAAKVGSYLHGLAGAIAVDSSDLSSLIASDIVQNIGFAYSSLRFDLIKQ